MKKYIWLIIGIVIVIILILVIKGSNKTMSPNQGTQVSTTTSSSSPSNPSQPEIQNSVSYYCDTGVIQANYTSASVALSLPNAQAITLPQTVSGSGIRYAEGNYVFSSEGSNATLMDGDKTIYNNCVSGTETGNNSTTTYTDTGNTFSFTFPSMFTLSGGGVGYSQDWAQNATTSGMLLAIVTVPQSYLPKTNFAGATFTVGTSSDPSAVSSCLTSPTGSTINKSQANINGQTFTKFAYSEGAAGSVYATTSYRLVANSQCYAVEYTIHSSNLGNYDPSQGITQFNQAKVQSMLDGIVQSFIFTQNQ